MTERDIQIAAVSWSIGTLMTTLLVLGSYLAWWRAEQKRTTTT